MIIRKQRVLQNLFVEQWCEILFHSRLTLNGYNLTFN